MASAYVEPGTTYYFAVPLTLETILNILEVPQECREDFTDQHAKRSDLRSRFEAFSNIPGSASPLPKGTPAMRVAWNKVANHEIPCDAKQLRDVPDSKQPRCLLYSIDLQCQDPKLIATALRHMRRFDHNTLSSVVHDLTTTDLLSASFAESMAELIRELIGKHENRVEADDVRRSVGKYQVELLTAIWV